MKWVKFILGSVVLVAVATFTAVHFGGVETTRLRTQIDQLKQQREQLLSYAQRLTARRRVAQVDVVRQRVDQRGRTVSTLLWQEIGPDGVLGKPVAVETIGHLVYFEALVLKFEPQFVGEGDPARGTSLALFRRIFGDCQAPDSVAELDRVARPPLHETDAVAKLHEELWRKFWDFVDDPTLAARYGVRVAQCEAPAVPLKTGQVWQVGLDALGGLNLTRLDLSPAPTTNPPATSRPRAPGRADSHPPARHNPPKAG